ncbi:MAG TPA: ABC transporter permease [Candidatus Angelobacter sp.]|nr:ABC transporter permease [Candidatus Angelobacter sp.]
MGSLRQDFRYGWRMLANNPRFTLVAIVTLALAIGASTTVFSWIDTVLLHPFPGVEKPGELLAFETTRADGESVETSYLDFRDYRDNLKSLSGPAMFVPIALNVGEPDRPDRVFGMMVTGNYFDVLGVKAAQGRTFLPREQGDAEGAFPVVVISDSLWRTRFHADPQIAGKKIRVNQHEMTIVGVAAPEFHGSMAGFSFDIWVPVVMQPQLQNLDLLLKDRNTRQLYGLARLKPGVTVEQARQEIAALAERIAHGSPYTNQGMSATLIEPWRGRAGAGRVLLAPLQILAGVCVVVLLIACANVANLQLARFVARRKDFSLRMALGARRIRLVRQILVESLLLAAGGALAGTAMATWMSGSIHYLLPPNGGGPTVLDVHLNRQAMMFAVLLCVVTALLAGLAPALQSIRANLDDSLKETGRSTTAGQGSQRLRSLLVVSEVSLALVALIGAGLFVRAFALTRTIDPGFDPNNLLVSSFNLATNGYSLEQRKAFCRRLREQMEAAPGVTAVGYADGAPLGIQGSWWEPIEVQGYVPATGENMKIDRNVVAPGYFSLMHIPFLEGHDFTEQDDESKRAPAVMIVTETFRKRFLPTGTPIGRKVRGWGMWFTVIGVAKDIKDRALTENPKPYFYVPFRQVYREDMNLFFFVRTAGDPVQAIASLRRNVREIDPNVIIFDSVPMAEYMGASWFAQKIAASMLSILGGLALLLAALGLYSVMSYSVTQRTHEIGVRMALGAQRSDVLALVLRRGMALTVAGLMAGAGLTLVLSRSLPVTPASLFATGGARVGHAVAESLIYLSAAIFLAMIAALATYVPALRATKVDPLVALRYE